MADGARRPEVERVEDERRHVALAAGLGAVGRGVACSVRLLITRRIRQPDGHVGDIVRFADGSSALVYRETVHTGESNEEPTALVVCFRLRWIRGIGHDLFRAESLLNTPLFVGFPGFRSKLWLAHDENGVYRGIYDWDGAERAHSYARALWWILTVVCERASIHYVVLPYTTRSELLRAASPPSDGSWWRVRGVDRG
jgi:hypothetical protein